MLWIQLCGVFSFVVAWRKMDGNRHSRSAPPNARRSGAIIMPIDPQPWSNMEMPPRVGEIHAIGPSLASEWAVNSFDK